MEEAQQARRGVEPRTPRSLSGKRGLAMRCNWRPCAPHRRTVKEYCGHMRQVGSDLIGEQHTTCPPPCHVRLTSPAGFRRDGMFMRRVHRPAFASLVRPQHPVGSVACGSTERERVEAQMAGEPPIFRDHKHIRGDGTSGEACDKLAGGRQRRSEVAASILLPIVAPLSFRRGSLLAAGACMR